MSSTAGQPIECKAAICFKPNEPLVVEDIIVAPPKAGEVRVKVLYCALCHTDVFTHSGQDSEGVYPVIFGHEATAVCESVGEGVTSVKPGDVVIPLYTAECRNCKFCLSNKSNLCVSVRASQGKGLMPDMTSRFTLKRTGEQIFHYMGCSSFSQYTVINEVSCAVIPKDSPLDKVCLLGCGTTTGMGAVTNTAKVQKGETVAVFGLGGVGLAAILAASNSEASMIIAVDLNSDKFPLATKLGATHCLNPKDYPDKPIDQVIIEMTQWGVDYSFECIGNVNVMRQALQCCHRGWGKSVIIGVAGAGQEISTRPFQLVTGRSWTGSAFGGVKGRTELPGMCQSVIDGKLDLDDFITGHVSLNDINLAFDKIHQPSTIRTIVKLWE